MNYEQSNQIDLCLTCPDNITQVSINDNVSYKEIKTMYTNANSLVNKIDDLKCCVNNLKPQIIMVTETWMSDKITEQEMSLDGYTWYSKPRLNRPGGGVCIYVKEEFEGNQVKCAVIEDSEFEDCEMIWMNIVMGDWDCLVACIQGVA